MEARYILMNRDETEDESDVCGSAKSLVVKRHWMSLWDVVGWRKLEEAGEFWLAGYL